MSDPEDVRTRLQAFAGAQLGGGAPTIGRPTRLGVGRSRENWAFGAQWPDGRNEQMILRQDPAGGLVESDRSLEFAALEALEGAGLMAPRALWLDADGQWLGSPSMVMLREPGTCEYDLLASSRPLATRLRLARELCELMARVHDADWRAQGLGQVLDHPGDHPSLHELQRWEQVLRRDQLEAYPEIDLVLQQLRETAPSGPQVTLVHADFKPGNVLLDEQDRIVALLDWELVHLGDPLEDLGWVTQPLRTREHLVPGAWERHDLVQHYESLRGAVDPSAVLWWNCFSTLKTAVMQVTGMRSFVEGRSDEPYRPTRKVLRTMLTSVLTAGESLAAHGS